MQMDKCDCGSMPMHFASSEEVTILFQSWKTESRATYVMSWFVVFAAVVCTELMKQKLRKWEASVSDKDQLVPLTVNSPLSQQPLLLDEKPADQIRQLEPWKTLVTKSLLSAFYTLIAAFHLLIMLVCMTYNVGLFFSVIAGTLAGDLFSRLQRSAATHQAACH
eukprot:ANDGO_07255.mRNA.1 hypothetical protein